MIKQDQKFKIFQKLSKIISKQINKIIDKILIFLL